MANTTVDGGPETASAGLIGRFIGVFTAPQATFRGVVARPRWFGMLALTTVLVAVATVLPMTTEAGREAALEQQVSQMESLGFKVDDAQYERMRQGMRLAPYTTGGGVIVVAPIMALIISGILFAIFTAAMGGTAAFKQVFAIVVHAGVISSLSAVFTGILNFTTGTMRTSAASLGRLLPFAEENSFVGRLLGAIDLFVIWWLIVLAMGLAVLYRRRTQPIAIALLIVYACIAVTIAAVMSRFGGGA
jgi:hypothetical protein